MQDLTRRHKIIGIAALALLSWGLRDEEPVAVEPSGSLAHLARRVPEQPVRRERLELDSAYGLMVRWSGDQRIQPAGAEPAYR